MAENDGTKLFALRVFNMTRSCVLMKQFTKTGTWTLPVMSIPREADPMNHIHSLLEQVGHDDKFELVSAVSIIEFTKTAPDDIEHHSIIYDLRYTGKVLKTLTKRDKILYKASKWVQTGVINKLPIVNHPTHAYIVATEKESCLR